MKIKNAFLEICIIIYQYNQVSGAYFLPENHFGVSFCVLEVESHIHDISMVQTFSQKALFS
jgi:hypothetical protein